MRGMVAPIHLSFESRPPSPGFIFLFLQKKYFAYAFGAAIDGLIFC